MIICILFYVAHTTLIQQSYSIKKQEQAVVHLSVIKQFTTNYQFGDLKFNLSIQANHPYTLLYIPDSSSSEYHCVAVLKLNYQDCFKENIFIEDDEFQCQQIIISHLQNNINGNQSQLPFLICDGFQNLTISNFLYKVKIQKPQTIITPAFILYNRFVNSKEGILVDFSMNLQYETNKADYEAVIILGIILVLLLLILSFILFLLCNVKICYLFQQLIKLINQNLFFQIYYLISYNRYKEIKKQIKYQDNVYKKIKEKSN